MIVYNVFLYFIKHNVKYIVFILLYEFYLFMIHNIDPSIHIQFIIQYQYLYMRV